MISPRWFQDLSGADFLKSVGLYVMPDRLYLVRMRRDLLRFSVVGAEIREIRSGDEASTRQALSDAVHSLLSYFNPARDPLYVCLSLDRAVACQVLLPQAAEENLQQVLDYEIERLLPFRREELYYDFLPAGKKGDRVKLFLFAVPKRGLDEILDVLASFGITPKGVEIPSTALSNYFLFCTRGAGGESLILGGEDRAWQMVGVRGGSGSWSGGSELLFSHWIPKAEWIKGPGREIFYSLVRDAPRLLRWGKAQDFLQFVDGGGVEVEDLMTLGNERLHGHGQLNDPFFIPAVGCALRGLRQASFPINLLPGAGEERQEQTLSRLNAFLTALLLAGLIAWGISYPIRDELRLRRVRQEISEVGPLVKALREKEEELTRLRKEISILSSFRARRGSVLRVLEELSRIVPQSAYLSNLRYRDGTLEMRGSAENASNLVPVLERSPLFQNVGFNAPSNRGRNNRETFSLKAEVSLQRDHGAMR